MDSNIPSLVFPKEHSPQFRDSFANPGIVVIIVAIERSLLALGSAAEAI